MGLKDFKISFSPTRGALKHSLASRKDCEETHPIKPEGFPLIFYPHPMGLKDLKKSFSPTRWAIEKTLKKTPQGLKDFHLSFSTI